jgi:hypothetical protein
MYRAIFLLNCLLCVFYPSPSWGWAYQGHRVVGSIADQMLNDNARQQVSQLLGFELRIAGPWADCVKSVVRNDDNTFTYREDPHHPDYEIPCTSFRTPSEQKRMEDYVGRNWTQCVYPPTGTERGCHNTYHFDDVAVERDRFDRLFMGTNEHDLVGAITAAIAVLRDMTSSGPFSIADKKEALFLLAHFLATFINPCTSGPYTWMRTVASSIPMLPTRSTPRPKRRVVTLSTTNSTSSTRNGMRSRPILARPRQPNCCR